MYYTLVYDASPTKYSLHQGYSEHVHMLLKIEE